MSAEENQETTATATAETPDTQAAAPQTAANAEAKTDTTAATSAPAPAPVRKPKRALWKVILSNPLFWLFVAIALLIGSIEYFERYTQVGINNTYKIF